jgi:putative addiction module component (TIGR02574 family)
MGMTNTATSLLEQALDLPEHDRAELAARLLESLDACERGDLDAAWAQEIDRRCDALDKGEAATSDWNEFRARVERDIFNR